MENNKTAAVLLIGNEILSGSTADLNLPFIAQALSGAGIRLAEARVVEDDYEAIASAVNLLRARYDYLFTTGGIGPTHDDITAEAIARAFGRQLELNEHALGLMEAFYGSSDKLNSGRRKMAQIPTGAELILNNVSAAPGFILENVYVMAGVPKIMQDMFANLLPRLDHAQPIVASNLVVHSGESSISEPLAELQRQFAQIAIGSYPKKKPDGSYYTELVFRSSHPEVNQQARASFAATLESEGIDFELKN